MKKRSLLILLFCLFLPLFLFAQGQLPGLNPKLHILVDPRIELLQAVLNQTSHADRFLSQDSEYSQQMREYFYAHRQHRAVRLLDEMTSQGFSYDAPPTFMLHLGAVDELDVRVEYTDYLMGRAGGRDELEELRNALLDFYHEANFQGFCDRQQEYYQAIENQILSLSMERDYIAELEEFYGQRADDFYLVASPLKPGGYGPKVKGPNGWEIYNIFGSTESETFAGYGDQGSFEYLLLHEFSHSFINPLAEHFAQEVQELEPLMEPIQGVMELQAYGFWPTVVNEHLVRAATTYFTYRDQGEEAGDAALSREAGRGFIYLEKLYPAMVEYTQNRDAYPSLADFYPRFLEVLQEYHQDPESIPQIIYNVNSALSFGDTIFVLPTAEGSTQLQNEIHRYVERIRNRFSPDSPMITDQEALERDLSEFVPVIYGTPTGNLYLAAMIEEQPFEIEEHQIRGGRTYNGSDFRLIFVTQSPEHPWRKAVVYTAQRPQEIIGINDRFHGPTVFSLFRGEDQVDAGGITWD